MPSINSRDSPAAKPRRSTAPSANTSVLFSGAASLWNRLRLVPTAFLLSTSVLSHERPDYRFLWSRLGKLNFTNLLQQRLFKTDNVRSLLFTICNAGIRASAPAPGLRQVHPIRGKRDVHES